MNATYYTKQIIALFLNNYWLTIIAEYKYYTL